MPLAAAVSRALAAAAVDDASEVGRVLTVHGSSLQVGHLRAIVSSCARGLAVKTAVLLLTRGAALLGHSSEMLAGPLDPSGSTVLHVAACAPAAHDAAAAAFIRCLAAVLPPCAVMAITATGNTVAHLAAWHGPLRMAACAAVAQRSVLVANVYGDYPLHLAALGGHVGGVTACLQAGALPNVVNLAGATALQAALHGRVDPRVAVALVHGGAAPPPWDWDTAFALASW